MDRKMMNAWLQGQAQKAQVTEAQIQRKRLGIKEGVNYGDINFRVPVDPDTGDPVYSAKTPRSPESAKNLTRRLQNLAAVAGDAAGKAYIDRQRAAASLIAKGVGPLDPPHRDANIGDIIDDVKISARVGEDLHAGVMGKGTREHADTLQKVMSSDMRAMRQRELMDRRNTIKTGGSKLPKALGAAGAVLGLATGAQAADIVHGLNPLSVLDSGSLGTDDMMGEPIEFKEPKPKQQKPLAGSEFMFPAKINENNMMNAWLAGQANKAQITEAQMQRKRLGVVPQAEARNKAGESATAASTPITEQLNAEEEKYAKEHKSMLAGMIKQYGKEKGTRVFYATVRNKVRGK